MNQSVLPVKKWSQRKLESSQTLNMVGDKSKNNTMQSIGSARKTTEPIYMMHEGIYIIVTKNPILPKTIADYLASTLDIIFG